MVLLSLFKAETSSQQKTSVGLASERNRRARDGREQEGREKIRTELKRESRSHYDVIVYVRLICMCFINI